MIAECISIGDELLIGKTINTNSAWIGEELAKIHIQTMWGQTVADTKDAILSALDLAFSRSNLIVMTGGLGPTKDDITKHVLCAYFECDLQMDQETLTRVEAFFAERGRPMLEVNRQQAALPAACDPVRNDFGTAPGMWFEKNGKVLISLPGVPYEMKGMMQAILLPKIASYFGVKKLYHRTVLTTGIGESFLAEEMKDWENRVRGDGFSLAYLPSPGMVKLRITSYEGDQDAKRISNYFDELKTKLPHHVFGEENDTLPLVVGRLMREKRATLGTVESCTGGALAAAIVGVAGSSDYFEGALITYSKRLKAELASVTDALIEAYDVVSENCVKQMAEGGKKKMSVDYCIATSGVAGPDDTPEHKAGTIWIAVATEGETLSRKLQLSKNRELNIEMTVMASLNLLRTHLLGISSNNKWV